MTEELFFDPGHHTYTLVGSGRTLPSVTQILEVAGLIDKSWYAEGSAEFGTHVHATCEFYDKGILDEKTLDPAFLPYLTAWKEFKDQTGFKAEKIEHVGWCPTYMFAGTVDRVGSWRLGKSNVIVDIKTNSCPAWAGIQLAGYEQLLSSGNLLTPYERCVIVLKNNGKYCIKPFGEKQDRGVFLGALSVFNWKKANMKGVAG